jgi:hypothetical protein
MTEINLNAIRENYNADPDRDDWPIQPVDAIGSDGQPTIACGRSKAWGQFQTDTCWFSTIPAGGFSDR